MNSFLNKTAFVLKRAEIPMENSYLRNTALNFRQFIRQIQSLLTKENQIDFISQERPVNSPQNRRAQIHRRNASCISMNGI